MQFSYCTRLDPTVGSADLRQGADEVLVMSGSKTQKIVRDCRNIQSQYKTRVVE